MKGIAKDKWVLIMSSRNHIIGSKLKYPQNKMANLFSFSLPFDIRRLKTGTKQTKITALSPITQSTFFIVI
jgi:hypothetical protein